MKPIELAVATPAEPSLKANKKIGSKIIANTVPEIEPIISSNA